MNVSILNVQGFRIGINKITESLKTKYIYFLLIYKNRRNKREWLHHLFICCGLHKNLQSFLALRDKGKKSRMLKFKRYNKRFRY